MQSRLSSLGLLALAGVVTAHTLGYLIADPAGAQPFGTGHAYLDAAALVVVPAAAVALVGIAVRSAKASLSRPVSWTTLALAQVPIYVLLEIYERAVTGDANGVLGSGAFWLGLALQLPVAVGLAALVHWSTRVATRLLTTPPPCADVGARVILRPSQVVGAVALPTPLSRRGPPVLSV